MGYSNYKNLRQVVDKFDLQVRNSTIIKNVEPLAPSEWLKKSLEYAYLSPLSNEKVKSERIISPILTELQAIYKDKLTLFSGEELNVQPEDDLNGACDFFFAAIPEAYLLEAPIVSLTEAKDEDMDYGIAQCAAQMIAARIFNKKKEQPTSIIWGCSTTAGEWKFLKLEGNLLSINKDSFYINELGVLLGAFHKIFETL